MQNNILDVGEQKMDKPLILNLGCGGDIRKDAVNVDVMQGVGIDLVIDLSVFPWPWKDESIDGIRASHIIEHFKDQEQFIHECLRILKKGGFLRLALPHSSSVTSIGCMGHYRTYSYDTINDYLSRDFYMFKTKRFETIEQRLNWWYDEIDIQRELPKWIYWIIRIINPVMNRIIKLSPRIFENVFCPTIQCREVIWKGRKI